MAVAGVDMPSRSVDSVAQCRSADSRLYERREGCRGGAGAGAGAAAAPREGAVAMSEAEALWEPSAARRADLLPVFGSMVSCSFPLLPGPQVP